MKTEKAILVVVMVLGLCGSVWAGSVVYVDIDAVGANNGTSWADAYLSLPYALSIASNGDEIRVAQGIYRPNDGLFSVSRDLSFVLKNGVTIKGGYAGFGEADPDARDIEAYETILSGDLSDNDTVFTDPADMWGDLSREQDNSLNVVTGSGTDATAILDGFTITAGYNTGWGGGMLNSGGGSPTIKNCAFKWNTAEWGGGMGNWSNSNPTVSNCTFSSNFGMGGGGMYNGNSSSPTVTNCIFKGNTSNWGGGGMYNNSSSPTVTNCTFDGNWAASFGGGIGTEGGSFAVITNCIFHRNSSSGAYDGGGIYVGEGVATLTNCQFSGNSADRGGGVYYNNHPFLTMTNCTFYGNSATAEGGGIGGEGSPIVTNCILWGNTPEGIYVSLGDPVITYSCIQDLVSTQDGNVNTDPLFVDADGADDIVGTEDDNLRLSGGTVIYTLHQPKRSPCINTGDNTVVTAATDLDGNTRIMLGAVDMGAYESGGFTWHVDGVNGDYDYDGVTRETALLTIQYAIDIASDGDTILVWPCVYDEACDFLGKAITVTSAADAAVVRNWSGYAFSFSNGEGEDSVLSNLVIAGGQFGIYADTGCTPMLKNLTIADNEFGISCFSNADPCIVNCILANDSGDLYGCDAEYSWVTPQIIKPITHLKLDETIGVTAIDSAGSDHGSLIHGPKWTKGQIKGALDFDGINDYVVMGSRVFENYFSVNMWVNLDSAPTTKYLIGTDSDPSEGFSLGISEERKLRFTDNAGAYVDSTGTVPVGSWHMITVVYKGGQIDFYHNGSLTNSESMYMGPGAGFYYLATRTHSDEEPSSEHFDGKIDDVAIYDIDLPSDEIAAIYEAGSAGCEYGRPGFVNPGPDNADYHLLSGRGRYRASTDEWLLDKATSPCIDAGDPMEAPTGEGDPNGGRVNQGAYGNTASASLSEWPLAHDSNRDGIVNLIDFAQMAGEWLDRLPWAE